MKTHFAKRKIIQEFFIKLCCIHEEYVKDMAWNIWNNRKVRVYKAVVSGV